MKTRTWRYRTAEEMRAACIRVLKLMASGSTSSDELRWAVEKIEKLPYWVQGDRSKRA